MDYRELKKSGIALHFKEIKRVQPCLDRRRVRVRLRAAPFFSTSITSSFDIFGAMMIANWVVPRATIENADSHRNI